MAAVWFMVQLVLSAAWFPASPCQESDGAGSMAAHTVCALVRCCCMFCMQAVCVQHSPELDESVQVQVF
jgi:hypothetical protein